MRKIKQFLYEVRRWGWKIALQNVWLIWTWRLIGAKKATITYKKKSKAG